MPSLPPQLRLSSHIRAFPKHHPAGICYQVLTLRRQAHQYSVTVESRISTPYRSYPTDPLTMAPIAVYPTPLASPEPMDSKTRVKTSVNKPKSSLFHQSQPRPLATSAQGLYFTLEDGQTVLDGMSGGAAVACLGQGNTEILGAMMEQASKMAYSYHQSVGCEAGEKLAEMICSKGDFEAAAFLNSGSEAVEACIKTVRQYWVEKGELQRKYIIARFPSYHGNTIGGLAVGNSPGRRNLYSPLFSDAVQHVDTPLYKRHSLAGETEEQYSDRLAFELEAKILELGPENCMAFFAEPVQGTAVGIMPPPRGYFPAIDAVLKKYDLLFVMDEVMSGAGRCGEFYAHQAVAEGVKPDVLSMAKGLGAGYVPISAVVVNKKVADVVRSGGQWKNSHTYQNHPIVCAVGVKILEIIERDDLLSNVKARGDQLEAELREAFKEVPEVFDIRGKGLFWGIEFEAPRHLSPRFGERVKNKAMDNGLIILGVSGTIDGVAGESAMLAPAYTVSAEQISEMVRLLKKSVVECIAEMNA